MKLIAYARDLQELNVLKNAGAAEVLLSHSQLSRLGKLTTPQLNQLASEARKLDLRPVLEWDILMTNEGFARAIETLNALEWASLSAVRVQDPGAFEWVLKNRVKMPIQLVLETGNRNLEAIRRWCEYGQGRVERVVLSIELPEARIAQMISELPVPVEILGLGPILLLYTPRHLLSNLSYGTHEFYGSHGSNDFDWMAQKDENAQNLIRVIQATASSEQTQHSGFRVIENQHGTLLFHAKDYCLLDQVAQLREMNLGAFRVDYRLEDNSEGLMNLSELLTQPDNSQGEVPNELSGELSYESKVRQFMQAHPRKVTRCFFKANATDVLFKKLKNTEIQRQDSGFIGEVVEISRGDYTIIHVLSKKLSLKLGQTLKFITPDGQNVEFRIQNLTDLDQRPINEISSGDFGMIQYVKRATPGSTVYLNFE